MTHINIEIVSKIRDYVDSLCNRFPGFVKITNHPKRPNFNRSTIESDIKLLWTEYSGAYKITIKDLIDKIEFLNICYKDNRIIPLFPTPTVRDKCLKYGLLLFSGGHQICRRDFDTCIRL
jgi:hypothetical protein